MHAPEVLRRLLRHIAMNGLGGQVGRARQPGGLRAKLRRKAIAAGGFLQIFPCRHKSVFGPPTAALLAPPFVWHEMVVQDQIGSVQSYPGGGYALRQRIFQTRCPPARIGGRAWAVLPCFRGWNDQFRRHWCWRPEWRLDALHKNERL